MAILKDLLVTGAARFKGKIYGNLAGHADTATTITGNITKSQVTDLTTDLTTLNNLTAEHTATLATHTSQIGSNTSEINTLKTNLEAVDAKIDESLGEQVGNLETELGGQISDLSESLNSHIASAATTYATKTELNNEAKVRGEADTSLGNRIKALEDKAPLHALQTALEAEVKNRADGDSALSSQISALQATAATHATQAALNKEITDRGTAVSGVDTKLTTHAGSVANGTTLAHVKLSDTASASNGVGQGYAATPKAVQSVVTQLQDHAAYAETMYIYTGDEVLTNSSVPINADTVGGWTKDEIIAAATGSSAATGTVGFTTGTVTNADNVILTNVSSGKHLLPKTTVANITDIDTKFTDVVKFVTGSSTPASSYQKLGTIWFKGSGAPYTICIWNGSAWEVMNSWQ